MKLYLAGPMSGIPKFNYPAFIEAADILREQGYEVVSPAEMDSKEIQELALASTEANLAELAKVETWGDMLASDVKLIADEVDGVVLLKGWENSRGARLEAFVAATVMKPVFELEELRQIPVVELMDVISFCIRHQGDVGRYKE